jgi:hypothetical protein
MYPLIFKSNMLNFNDFSAALVLHGSLLHKNAIFR